MDVYANAEQIAAEEDDRYYKHFVAESGQFKIAIVPYGNWSPQTLSHWHKVEIHDEDEAAWPLAYVSKIEDHPPHIHLNLTYGRNFQVDDAELCAAVLLAGKAVIADWEIYTSMMDALAKSDCYTSSPSF